VPARGGTAQARRTAAWAERRWFRPVLYTTLEATPIDHDEFREAQRWFDQGLRLVYAFNHLEAQRASERPRVSIRVRDVLLGYRHHAGSIQRPRSDAREGGDTQKHIAHAGSRRGLSEGSLRLEMVER